MDVITYQVSDFDGELFGLIHRALTQTCDTRFERNPHASQQIPDIKARLEQCNQVAKALMSDDPDITRAFDGIPDSADGFQDSVDFLRWNLPSHHRTTLTDAEYNLAWTLFHHLDHDWIMYGPYTQPTDLRWSSAELGTIVEQCVKRYFEHDDDETGADPVYNFLSTVAQLTKTHLATIFKTYLDEIARGSDPVQALTDSPFREEGGALRELTIEENASTSVAQHGFDNLSLQEQLNIIKEAYSVPKDEYSRWSTIIFNVGTLEDYTRAADEGEAESDSDLINTDAD